MDAAPRHRPPWPRRRTRHRRRHHPVGATQRTGHDVHPADHRPSGLNNPSQPDQPLTEDDMSTDLTRFQPAAGAKAAGMFIAVGTDLDGRAIIGMDADAVAALLDLIDLVDLKDVARNPDNSGVSRDAADAIQVAGRTLRDRLS